MSPHYFVIGLAFRVEVRAALAAAHRQRRQAVFEGLLEGEELQNAQVYRRVETDAAFIGADRAVHFDAVAFVDLDLPLVVEPRNAEHHDSFGFGDAFQDFHFLEHGIFEDVRGQRFYDLVYGLVKLFFTRISGDDIGHEIVDILLNVFFHRIRNFIEICFFALSVFATVKIGE